MEASTIKTNTFAQPQPLSELLPGLCGILSKEAMVTLTAKKQPRTTTVHTRTAEKNIKPLTLAEMSADIMMLNPQSTKRSAQPVLSAKKKGWNSSVKVDKKISHLTEGQLKNTTVRKALTFQAKPKAIPPLPRITIQNFDTPKFPKPEFRAKKSLHLQAKNNIRISGICNIPQTPVETMKPPKSRMTIANKENNPYQRTLIKKLLAPPISKIATPKADTPLYNSSWKSGSDASFLQKEREILEVEEKIKAVAEEHTLENIAEVSPPVSTPFKEYRSVQEYFNNSSCIENSALYNDNTIMCFDKPSISEENTKREESVIVTLCDLFNKATVTVEKTNSELDDLVEVQKQIESDIEMLENGIKMLTKIKESQQKSLENVKKLIDEKQKITKTYEGDKTLVPPAKDNNEAINKTLSPEKSPILSKPCSVIKSLRSPSYKIPKKNRCLRKKLVCKSMPNVSTGYQTPVKEFEGRALNMYMNMKQQMNFLSTPMVNREIEVPDTPAVTSHNLQKQLDKLFAS